MGSVHLHDLSTSVPCLHYCTAQYLLTRYTGSLLSRTPPVLYRYEDSIAASCDMLQIMQTSTSSLHAHLVFAKKNLKIMPFFSSANGLSTRPACQCVMCVYLLVCLWLMYFRSFFPGFLLVLAPYSSN